MNTKAYHRALMPLVFAALALMLSACGTEDRAPAALSGATREPFKSTLTDSPLTESQVALIEMAFKAASAIPLEPHIKDRSREQESVVEACLELNLPLRADRYAGEIENWRQGHSHAAIAYYCAERGAVEEADEYIAKAQEIVETDQDWRRDRIRVLISQTLHLLGRDLKAQQFATNIVPSETGKTISVRGLAGEEDPFDDQMADLEALVATGDTDILLNVLNAYGELYSQNFEHAERREAVLDEITSARTKVPVLNQIELILGLADTALEHQNQVRALEHIDQAQMLFDTHEWIPEYSLPVIGQLAQRRFLAGQQTEARAQLDRAWASFDTDRELIVNIYRGKALRPLAEAYHAMGDAEMTQSVYKRAVEEGVVNPNSRPRAEDLSATCLSMVLHRVEPDDELWGRICQIYDGLGPPW